MIKPAPTNFVTFGHILHALEDAAMTIVRRVAADEDELFKSGMRNFAVLSAIVRRSVVVSMHLRETGALNAVPKRSVLAAIDRELEVFAAQKMGAETYQAVMDGKIDADDDFSDIPGRAPAGLVAELCRDFGMVAHAVPADYVEALPSEIRLLAARAAAAALRPSETAARIGHLMER